MPRRPIASAARSPPQAPHSYPLRARSQQFSVLAEAEDEEAEDERNTSDGASTTSTSTTATDHSAALAQSSRPRGSSAPVHACEVAGCKSTQGFNKTAFKTSEYFKHLNDAHTGELAVHVAAQLTGVAEARITKCDKCGFLVHKSDNRRGGRTHKCDTYEELAASHQRRKARVGANTAAGGSRRSRQPLASRASTAGVWGAWRRRRRSRPSSSSTAW